MAMKYRNYAPALMHGAKIYPEDIAGMIGLPSVGTIWYVDPGKSVSGGGTSREDAFKTVLEAYNACTADKDDVVLITPSTSTGRTTEAASIVWAKRRTHLIGSTSPISLSARAGMSFSSTATTPSFTLSAANCIFKNITMAQFNDVNVLFSLTGSRNYFEGVYFAGIGHATAGDDADARCVEVEGAGENRWVDCTFGIDTVARSTTNATLSFGGVCARNELIGCKFNMLTDNAGPNHILIENNDAAQRYLILRDCLFHNPDTASSTNITEVIGHTVDAGAHTNGTIMLLDSWYTGATDWADGFAHIWFNMGKPDTDEGGDLIIAT